MPFGLKSAPTTFTHFVHEVLYSSTPELKNHTEVYLDKILIHTKDFKSHQAVFDQICQNLSHYNLAIYLHKSILAHEKLNYISFKVSADGYSAKDEKIKTIVEYPLMST